MAGFISHEERRTMYDLTAVAVPTWHNECASQCTWRFYCLRYGLFGGTQANAVQHGLVVPRLQPQESVGLEGCPPGAAPAWRS